MHPTTRLVVWLLCLLASQTLQAQQLLVALLLLPLVGAAALRRGTRLVWRTRWLFLSLSVIMAWGGAGDALWEGPLSPTREGMLDAWTHAGRLLVALMAVALLFERMPLVELLVATLHLLQPLRSCGLDPERSVVRLSLVMRYIEALPHPRDWRVLLDMPAAGGDEVLQLSDRPFAWFDPLLMLLAAAAVMLVFFWQA